MEAPEKVYLGIEELDSGYVYNLSLENNGHAEYIRKDALVEWLKSKIKIPDVGFITGLTYVAYQDIIEHINEM